MADEWSLLRRAIDFQRLDLVRKHLGRGPQVCRQSGDPWDPPLVRAVSVAAGSVGEAIVQALLDGGHDAGARSTEGKPTLHSACLNQQIGASLVRRLVTAGADIEARDGRGQTALHAAVEVFTHGIRCDSVAAVVALLELGASVDAPDARNRTPLHVAVSKGTDPLNVVQTLLAWHADPNALDDAGTTPWTLLRQLVGAARAESMDVGRALRLAGAHEASSDDDRRDRVVSLLAGVRRRASSPRLDNDMGDAAARGDLAGVQEWLDDGADPDAPRRNGWYPIQRAKLNQHGHIVEFLLARGAQDREPRPVTPERVEAAAALGNAFRVLTTLVGLTDDDGAEDVSTEECDRRVAQAAELIVAGALGDRPYAVRVLEDPILKAVAREGHLPVVTALLGLGAPPPAAGHAALLAAAQRGFAEIVAALLRAGVDPSARGADQDEDTPLMKAARRGSVPTVRLLLDAGADPLALRPGGFTAINLAEGPKQERIRALIRLAAARRPSRRRGASVRCVGDPLENVAAELGGWRYARAGGHRSGPFALIVKHDDVAEVARLHAQMHPHVALFEDALETAVAWAPRFDAAFRLKGHPWTIVLLDRLGTSVAREESLAEAVALARTLGVPTLWVSADDPAGSGLNVQVEARAFGTPRSEAGSLQVSANPHYEDYAVDPWFASHGVFVPTCRLGADPWRCTVGISGVRKRDLAGLAILVVEADAWPARLAREEQLSKH